MFEARFSIAASLHPCEVLSPLCSHSRMLLSPFPKRYLWTVCGSWVSPFSWSLGGRWWGGHWQCPSDHLLWRWGTSIPQGANCSPLLICHAPSAPPSSWRAQRQPSEMMDISLLGMSIHNPLRTLSKVPWAGGPLQIQPRWTPSICTTANWILSLFSMRTSQINLSSHNHTLVSLLLIALQNSCSYRLLGSPLHVQRLRLGLIPSQEGVESSDFRLPLLRNFSYLFTLLRLLLCFWHLRDSPNNFLARRSLFNSCMLPFLIISKQF